jgi:hypothetical protein
MGNTYRFLAQIIRDTYYKGKSSDDANFSLRYFAELVAQEVAQEATRDAYEQSNQGESTYSNDQFISTYKGVAIQVDTDGEKYSILPATPAGLPKNREIVSLRIIGNKCMDCVPMRNHASFQQDLIGIPMGMVLYKIENGKVIYVTDNPIIGGTATFKLVGAINGDVLLDSLLNIPKNVQSRITTTILGRLFPIKQIPEDKINDDVANPA